MTPKRKQRLLLIICLIVGVSGATALVLTALSKNTNYFFSPTEISAGKAPTDRTIRIGGMVVDQSVKRSDNDLTVLFDLTDTANVMTVSYTGILPDLFREGQGIVATGQLVDGMFVASQVLAKHDENYMPPEVKEALDKAHKKENGY